VRDDLDLHPGYLIVVMAGGSARWRCCRRSSRAACRSPACSSTSRTTSGPELTDILSSLTCIIVMVAVLKLWKPKTIMRLEGDSRCPLTPKRHRAGELFMAWMPYLLLVVFVLAVGEREIKPSSTVSATTCCPTRSDVPSTGSSPRLMVPACTT
jgi:lactate permease